LVLPVFVYYLRVVRQGNIGQGEG